MGERHGIDPRWCPRCLWLREKCICEPCRPMLGGETNDANEGGFPNECGGWLHENADNPELEPSWCTADDASGPA